MIEAFRLYPHAAFAREIAPAEPLGDDPFEPLLTRRLTEGFAADHGLVVESDTSHSWNALERYVRPNDEAAGASRQWGQLPIDGAPSGDVRSLRNADV